MLPAGSKDSPNPLFGYPPNPFCAPIGWPTPEKDNTTGDDLVTDRETSGCIQISYLWTALTFFQCRQHSEVSSLTVTARKKLSQQWAEVSAVNQMIGSLVCQWQQAASLWTYHEVVVAHVHLLDQLQLHNLNQTHVKICQSHASGWFEKWWKKPFTLMFWCFDFPPSFFNV